MAVTMKALAVGADTNAGTVTTFTTTSLTLSTTKLQLAMIGPNRTPLTDPTSIVGKGLTWVKVNGTERPKILGPH